MKFITYTGNTMQFYYHYFIASLFVLFILPISTMEIPSLKTLAARVIAQECDPEHAEHKAYANLVSSARIAPEIATLIKNELAVQAHPRLKTILAKQIPIDVDIVEDETLPDCLEITQEEGIFIHTKHEANYDEEGVRYLYLGQGTFIPDPIESSTQTFSEFFTNAQKMFYFQNNITAKTRKIWDAQTRRCINDCSVVLQKIQEKSPNADLCIEGIAQHTALARFWHETSNDSFWSVCFFDFTTNEIYYLRDRFTFSEVSTPGSMVVFQPDAAPELCIAIDFENQNVHDFLKPDNFLCRAISPMNDYLLLENRNEQGPVYIYRLNEKQYLPLVTNPIIELATGQRRSSISPNGKFLAVANTRNEYEILLFNTENGNCLHRIPAQRENPGYIGDDELPFTTFSPDNKQLLIFTHHAKRTILKVFDIAKREYLRIIGISCRLCG